MRSRLPRYLGRCKSTLVHLWLTTPGWVLYLAAVLCVATAHPCRKQGAEASARRSRPLG